jgi:hypothetical protein
LGVGFEYFIDVEEYIVEIVVGYVGKFVDKVRVEFVAIDFVELFDLVEQFYFL